jgi:hypothetical protein
VLGRLLGGQAPDAGICLELGNVLGLGVVFVAGTRRLGLLLLLLVLEALVRRRRLASVVQGLFLFKGTSDFVGGAEEVKVLAYTATTTKGIVVEGIASLVESVGQGIVGVVEVEAGAGSVMDSSKGSECLELTHHLGQQLARDWRKQRRPAGRRRSRDQHLCPACPEGGWYRSQRRTSLTE